MIVLSCLVTLVQHDVMPLSILHLVLSNTLTLHISADIIGSLVALASVCLCSLSFLWPMF